MIEVSENPIRQADEDAADAILAVQFDNSHTLYKLEIAAILAAHRQQAEDAMRERCAVLCGKHAGILALAQGHEDAEGQEDRWYDGGKYAAKSLATAIRGIGAGKEG